MIGASFYLDFIYFPPSRGTLPRSPPMTGRPLSGLLSFFAGMGEAFGVEMGVGAALGVG